LQLSAVVSFYQKNIYGLLYSLGFGCRNKERKKESIFLCFADVS
jgi:hypothetical protein